MLINQSILLDIKAIIVTAKDKAIRAVDTERTLMYWHIGKYIFEEEQQGENRAKYGEYQTKYISLSSLSQNLVVVILYAKYSVIANLLHISKLSALRIQFSCTQYKLLLVVDLQDKSEFYIAETVKKL